MDEKDGKVGDVKVGDGSGETGRCTPGETEVEKTKNTIEQEK